MKQALTMTGNIVRPGDGGERGAVLVEAALVVPVLLAIGLGVFEFGNAFYQYHLMSNAVRDAARYASGVTDIDAVCTNGSATQNAIKDIALRTGKDPATGNQIKIWPGGRNNITVTCTAGVSNSTQYYRGPATIRSVTVAAAAPYQSLGLLGFFKLSTPTLTVYHQERLLGGR